MRSGIIAAALLILLGAAANAQTAQSPLEQALGSKLMSELNAGLTCGSSLIEVQRALSTAQARVKELEARYEPAAAPKK